MSRSPNCRTECVICGIRGGVATAFKECFVCKAKVHETCAVALLRVLVKRDSSIFSEEEKRCYCAGCLEQVEEEERKKDSSTVKKYGFVFIGAAAATMAAPMIVGAVVGVTTVGPVAEGLFAAAQPSVGSIAVGGVLATTQSFVMGGVSTAACAVTVATAAASTAAYDRYSKGSNSKETRNVAETALQSLKEENDGDVGKEQGE